MTELYDSIGPGYSRYRRPDRRIERAILGALDGCGSVVNVGAGTGSYEPRDRFVVAVEPSAVMIHQRAPRSAPAVQASATALPFLDGAFDASIAVLTVHHWADWRAGIRELARSARRRVAILTWDPSAAGFWLVNDYFPEILDTDRRSFPAMADLARELGRIRVESIPIPHDCSDGFLGAYWRRPHAYLDQSVRSAISAFSKIANQEPGLARLRRELQTGAWLRRNAALLTHESLDLGYRLVTTH
ncbi:MAG TPA: class I SAM-dependent methyltransferase [Vicinamibacterales bacterium]|jgi:SAM-dependent methyltransferase